MKPKRDYSKYREYNRGHAAGLRQAIILVLGGKCRRCPVHDPAVLNVHHKKGDGGAHRKVVGVGSMLYRSILRTLRTGGYQLLCASCHQKLEWIKRHRKPSKARKTS